MAGKKDDKPFNDMVKNLLTWAIIAVVLLSIFNHYAAVNSTPNALTYSDSVSYTHLTLPTILRV